MRSTKAGPRTRQVDVPATVHDISDAGTADYRVAVRLDDASPLSPVEWARGVFECAPAQMRAGLVAGWRLGFRLQLGPLYSPTTALGWYLTENTPAVAVLSADSPLMQAQHHFLITGGGVTWVTLVRGHSRVGRGLWRLAAPGHEASMSWLLTRAARRARELADGQPGRTARRGHVVDVPSGDRREPRDRQVISCSVPQAERERWGNHARRRGLLPSRGKDSPDG